ncbi:MAG: hypothetical protein Q8S84_06715 [bacterium]|nr:hypothetical protein [bacterium]MDP3381151.1 hypothetical protein [bacterium]
MCLFIFDNILGLCFLFKNSSLFHKSRFTEYTINIFDLFLESIAFFTISKLSNSESFIHNRLTILFFNCDSSSSSLNVISSILISNLFIDSY